MLKPIQSQTARAEGGHFAIVASRYNGRFVDSMLRAARAELRRAGARRVTVIRVPGAFELPVVVGILARQAPPRPDAIICLGVILRGETTHAEHIGASVSQAFALLQTQTGVPVIHEVLLLENQQQAEVRCLSREHNRGTEAAQTAIAMAQVLRHLERPSRKRARVGQD